ncbi:MAG: hypothetical protein DCC68_20470 [Planctomycetota bacterium]|nr:MAG: hypothetical protein DCC68_20470 [Planctomycetota bacterium]
MTTATRDQRRQAAAEAFDTYENRRDGANVVARLDDGFTLLAKLFYNRIHGEVEQHLGIDSFYDPLSQAKAEFRTKAEILTYVACEAALFAEERTYVRPGAHWCEHWLANLLVEEENLVGGSAKRLAGYREKTPDDRRRAFSLVLERAFPEATRAPLVIYRLFPLAIRLATAQAFGRDDHAQAQRDRQLVLLPSILDCHTCHGALLPVGESCAACGNPFWTYELLTTEW